MCNGRGGFAFHMVKNPAVCYYHKCSTNRTYIFFMLRWGRNMWQLLYCGDTVADMAKKNVRIDEIIKFIQSEGGTTTKTNAEIAAALSSVENRHSGAIRVSEVLSELEDSGVVEVARSRRHPVNNPSGRSITLVE